MKRVPNRQRGDNCKVQCHNLHMPICRSVSFPRSREWYSPPCSVSLRFINEFKRHDTTWYHMSARIAMIWHEANSQHWSYRSHASWLHFMLQMSYITVILYIELCPDLFGVTLAMHLLWPSTVFTLGLEFLLQPSILVFWNTCQRKTQNEAKHQQQRSLCHPFPDFHTCPGYSYHDIPTW